MPGSTFCTLPLYISPTMDRRLSWLMKISCSTPSSRTATRASSLYAATTISRLTAFALFVLFCLFACPPAGLRLLILLSNPVHPHVLCFLSSLHTICQHFQVPKLPIKEVD